MWGHLNALTRSIANSSCRRCVQLRVRPRLQPAQRRCTPSALNVASSCSRESSVPLLSCGCGCAGARFEPALRRRARQPQPFSCSYIHLSNVPVNDAAAAGAAEPLGRALRRRSDEARTCHFHVHMCICPTCWSMISQLRVRLGALGRAFSRRSNEARTSHEAHKVALAVLALQDALAEVRCHQLNRDSIFKSRST